MTGGANPPGSERTFAPTTGSRLRDYQPLLPAEKFVVTHLLSGEFDRLGDGSLPVADDAERAIRAVFLRFLLLGGDEGCRPHEKGVRLSGAWITGVLDLEACRLFRDIGLKDCRFDAAPVLRSAIIDRLFLDGSSLPGLHAERLDARGGLYLRGAAIAGEVRLSSARLGGNLECDAATIELANGFALSCDGIEARSVLARGTTFRGGINLSGARLGADFDGTGATVQRTDGVAVAADALDAGGSVLLRAARIEGEVRLVGSRIGGDLDCTGASLVNPGRDALQASRATIEGAFFLRKGAAVDGALALTGTSIDSIHDEPACWPKPGNLLLNRCRYGGFMDGPADAETRLDWLSRQTPERWGEDFWPQPYEQLASVFREMGHDEDARAVLIAKERLQRLARRRRARSRVWRLILAAKDGLLGATVAYGRQPLLAFVWLIFFWLLGVLVFWNAEREGAFKPRSPVILRSPEWTLCGLGRSEQRFLALTQQMSYGRAEKNETQLTCFRNQWEAASYPTFNAWIYSLDTLLPVLDMNQKTYWLPDPNKEGGNSALGYFYFQSIVGWALSLLAVAGFSGLVKSR